MQDIFDNEFGHGILAVNEVTVGNAIHSVAIRQESLKSKLFSKSTEVNKMNLEDIVYQVESVNTREQTDVNFSVLVSDAVDFLEHFGEEYLLGKVFYDIIGAGDGQTKLHRL